MAEPGTYEILGLNSDMLVYVEQSGPVLIDQGTLATVDDSGNGFNAVKLVVDIQGMAVTEVLSVQHQGSGTGEVGVLPGGTITFEGVPIGTATFASGIPLSITFNSSATSNAVSALLQNLTYEDTGDAPLDGLITVALLDASGELASATVVLEPSPQDDLPVATADTALVGVNQEVTGNVLANDADPDSPSNSAILSVVGFNVGPTASNPPSMPANLSGLYGTLKINADGSYTYKSDNAFGLPPGGSVTDVFSYTVESSQGGQAAAAIEITIENGPGLTISNLEGDVLDFQEQSDPILIDQAAGAGITTSLGSFVDFTVTVLVGGMLGSEILSVRDQGMSAGEIGHLADGSITFEGVQIGVASGGIGGALTIVLTEDATAESIEALLRNLTYQDTGEAPRNSLITVAIANGGGPLASAVVTLVAAAENDAPVATDDLFSVVLADETSVTGNVKTNDFDPDDPSDPGLLSVVSVSAANGPIQDVPADDSISVTVTGTYGTLTLDASGAFTYEADNANSLAPGITASDTFTYVIGGGQNSEASATISFAVTASPFQIANLGGKLTYEENTTAILIDSGADATLTLTNFSDAILTVSLPGMLSSETLSVTDQGPFPGQIGFDENGTITFGGIVIGQATGGIGSALTITFSDASLGAVQALLRTLTYVDTSDAVQDISRPLTISFADTFGTLASAIVTLESQPDPDPLIAQNDAFTVYLADDTLLTGNVTSNDFDPDDPSDSTTFSLVAIAGPNGIVETLPTPTGNASDPPYSVTLSGDYGTLLINETGAFSYEVTASIPFGTIAMDVFTYTIEDISGIDQDTATLAFTVVPTGLTLFQISNLNGEKVSYLEQSVPILLDPDGSATVTAPQGFEGETLTVSVSKPYGTETFTIVNENLEGTKINLNGTLVMQDSTIIGEVTSGPGEVLAIELTSNATEAAVAALLHRIGYEDSSDAPTNQDVIVSLTKDSQVLVSVTLKVEAETEDDAPVFETDAATVTAGTFLTGNVTDNDSDPDDAGATFSVTGANSGAAPAPSQSGPGTGIQGSFGTLTLSANGAFVYEADNTDGIPVGGSAKDVFTYTAASSAGGEASGLIEITVANPLPPELYSFSEFSDLSTYNEQSDLAVVDQGLPAAVTSNDLGWDEVVLRVTLGSAAAGESITLQNQGAGLDQIGISGSTVTFGGVAIGTLVQTASTSFELTFNALATDSAASAVLRAIRYENPLEVVEETTRVVTASVIVGTVVSGAASATIALKPVDDLFVLPAEDAAVAVENGSASGNVLTNDLDPDRLPKDTQLVVLGATPGVMAPPSQMAAGPLVIAGLYGTLI